MMEFKKQAQCLDPHLEDSLFQSPKKVHLTAGVMKISPDQEEEAKDVLQSVKTEVIDKVIGPGGKLKVTIEGIDCFFDKKNPIQSKTRVLYAKIKSDELQQIADGIVKLFVDKGLMDRELQSSPDLSVKLHVTLMNQTFRSKGRDRGQNRGRNPKDRWSFDSTQIIQNLNNFVFLKDHVINEVHLSYFTEKDVNGYYKALDKLFIN